jgi:hypothetical protein
MKRTFPAAALAALLCIGVSRGAEAQFGKIKKAVSDQAASTAGVTTKKTVTVDQIGLTVEDLQALRKGISAEVAAAPAIFKQAEEDQKNLQKAGEKYSREQSAYEKAKQKWDECGDKLVASEQSQEDALAKKADAAMNRANMSESDQVSLEAKAMKAQEAAAKVAAGTATAEDRRVLQEFQQTMAGVSATGASAAASTNEASQFTQGQAGRVTAKCGPEPQPPTAPGYSSEHQMAVEKFHQTGREAAGMEQKAYWIKREELISLCGNGAVVAETNPNSSPLNNGLKDACPIVLEMQTARVPI